MRRQELIYAQTVGNIRNKDILNVSTSSDICVFESPIFEMSGATKMVGSLTATSNGVHILDDSGSIPLSFQFVENLESLTNDLNFTFQIYKYDEGTSVFRDPSTFKSESYPYSAFSATNRIDTTLSASDIVLDGEYLIKGAYDYNVCTQVLNKLGLRNTTTSFRSDLPYYLYNNQFDYYFLAINPATKPIFDLSPDDERPLGALNAITIIPSGETSFLIEDGFSGKPIVTFNGSVLSQDEDFTISGNTVYLNEQTNNDDIITVFFVGVGRQNGLVGNNIVINSAIQSGKTDGQGNAEVYYNVDSGKYEVFTETNPTVGNDVIISLNGVVLANNIDYYQSISDPRRFIMQGILKVDDIITIVYNGKVSYVGAVEKNTITVYWTVDKAPQKINGRFLLQVATDKGFENIVLSLPTDYVVGNQVYSKVLNLDYPMGTKLYYRVRNEKNYKPIFTDAITTITDSEIIPIIIQTNSGNSY